MSTILTVIFSILTILAVLALLLPLRTGVRSPLLFFTDGARKSDDLRIRRRVIVENLRDLQIERELGKLSEERFRELAGPLAGELETVEAELQAAGTPARQRNVQSNRLGWYCPECGALNRDPELTFTQCVQCGLDLKQQTP